MQNDLDHAHIFASDVNATIRWWSEMLGAKVVLDVPLGGSRMVRLAVGKGAIILTMRRRRSRIGQRAPPGDSDGRPGGLVASMEAKGVKFRDPIRDLRAVKFIMVMAPDDVFLELFQTTAPQ